jgi:hypothetical protein
MLFIDYSSGFNTIVPFKLITKLRTVGLNTSLCNWILDFLMGHTHVVRVGNNTSATLILRGACLVPSCTPCSPTNAWPNTTPIIKFADDTTVLGLITNNNETAYREEVRNLAVWCQDNNLSLNVSKIKELIVDYRNRRAKQSSINVDGAVVEWVESFKLFCVHITNKLSWSKHTKSVMKRTQQHHFPLRD